MSDDERSIRSLVAEEQAAWNAGDANAYAAKFHEEGSFPNVFGDRYFGRDSFQSRHAAIFNTFARDSKDPSQYGEFTSLQLEWLSSMLTAS